MSGIVCCKTFFTSPKKKGRQYCNCLSVCWHNLKTIHQMWVLNLHKNRSNSRMVFMIFFAILVGEALYVLRHCLLCLYIS